MNSYFAGIDAGSSYIKIVLLDEQREVIGHGCRPTGIHADNSSTDMLNCILSDRRIPYDAVRRIIATGYGRRTIGIAHDTVTEIKAHAMGAVWSAPPNTDIRTIIDIGGQDSKVIVINEKGDTENFVMNDKCAAGTGRFLESMARALELGVDDLGGMSMNAEEPLDINSTCVVFAESEVISLVAREKKREDIIAGVHQSLARRVASMARKVHYEPDILFTGGGGLNKGLAECLEDELMATVYTPEYPQFNGAVGAAVIAQRTAV